jgi:hypothetical protein
MGSDAGFGRIGYLSGRCNHFPVQQELQKEKLNG